MLLAGNDLVISADEGKLLRKKKVNAQDFVNWAKSKFSDPPEIHRVVVKQPKIDIINKTIVFDEEVIFDLEAAE
jgi:hypothetical protein